MWALALSFIAVSFLVFEHCLSHFGHSFMLSPHQVLKIPISPVMFLFSLILQFTQYLLDLVSCHHQINPLQWLPNPSSDLVFFSSFQALPCCADSDSLRRYFHSWRSMKTRILMSCSLELCRMKSLHLLTLVNWYRLSFSHFCAEIPFSNDISFQPFRSFVLGKREIKDLELALTFSKRKCWSFVTLNQSLTKRKTACSNSHLLTYQYLQK